jgi:hypothetical protein
METLHEIFVWFAMHPAPGVTANDLNDYLGSIILGGYANFARVLFSQTEMHQNGGWRRLRAAPIVGGAFGLGMAMFASVAFKSDELTWFFAMLAGLLGPSWAMKKLEDFGDVTADEATKSTGETIKKDIARNKDIQQTDEDRENKQRREIDDLKHKQEMDSLIKEMEDEQPDDLIALYKGSNQII